jgi:hypothetical protein
MRPNKLRILIASIAFLLAFNSGPPANAYSEVSFEFFHSSLSPAGSWHMSAAFGEVWQPYIEVEHWHPYAYGHWVYTDFGWTWVSDYDWGAIPFHYGTWVIEPALGWVWVPGYVWAPAWVVYRTGPSYIGWAPVPPSFSIGVSFNFGSYYEPDYFVFVPDRHFCDRRIDRYAMPVSRTRVIYNETVIINNNITIDNHVVVNRGLDYRRIERVSERRPERMRIESVPRIAPRERVSREALRENPREALRVDPRQDERGRVRVVTDEGRREGRIPDERRHDRAVEPNRVPIERPAPDVEAEHDRRERGRDRALERDRDQERSIGEQRDRADRDRQERAQPAHEEDARARRDQERAREHDARIEEERAAGERERANRQPPEREIRDREQRQRGEQERAAREQEQQMRGQQERKQRAHEQERAMRDQEQQQRREQDRAAREHEQQMRQEQERAQQAHEQERAMRDQEQQQRREQDRAARGQEQQMRQEQERAQQAHEQERAAREQQQRDHEQRAQQERARQQRRQESEQGQPENPDDQPRGRGHNRD